MLWRREICVALLGIKPQFLVCPAHTLVTNGLEIESRWELDFLHLSSLVLGPTQPPIREYRAFPGGKAVGAWR